MSSDEFVIEAKPRDVQGKGASRRLRREGLVPGIVYGAGKSPQPIAVAHHKLLHEMDDEAFFSSLITLKVDGKKQRVVVKDVQRHPAKPVVQHVDFMRVRMDEAIRMTVPIHFEGEEEAPGVKVSHGILMRAMNELEIECLPANLPEAIVVDVSSLDVGDSIHLSQIQAPEGVVILEQAEIDEENDPLVVTIEVPHMEEEPEAEESEEASEAGEEAGAAGEPPAEPTEE